MSPAKRVYLSMIRGINVGGHKRLKMALLRDIYADLGFESPATYVQSGNVAFLSKQSDPKKIASAIETGIEQATGYSVSAVVRTPTELDRVISDTPYPRECEAEPALTGVVFLAEKPKTDASALSVPEGSSEKLFAKGQEIYFHCPNGIHKSKFTINFFEKTLGVSATARNWRTVLALRDLAEKTASVKG